MKIERVVMTGPRQVELETAELSDEPLAPYEVLLRTHYSMISPGTELAYYAGDQDLGHRQDPYPFHPGYAAAGEVLAAGSEAPVQQGDHVLAHTPHQSISRFDSRRQVCVRVPDGLPLDHVPLARLGQVSAVSMRMMHAHAGDRGAVVGLGLVGNLAAQLLRCAGIEVLGVEKLAHRRELAMRCGIAETCDPGDLGGEGPGESGMLDSCRVVLECSGNDRGVLTALSLAARHGEVFLVGAAWKRGTEVVAADVVRPVFNKFLALRSGWEWQIPHYGEGPTGSIARCNTWVLNCLRDGTVHADELLTDRLVPSEAAAGYAGLFEHPAEHLGVLLDWHSGRTS